MNRQKLILSISILLGCIILGGFYFATQKQKEEKYGDCITSCIKTKTCLKSAIDDSALLGTRCLEWSDGLCNNICVQKYK